MKVNKREYRTACDVLQRCFRPLLGSPPRVQNPVSLGNLKHTSDSQNNIMQINTDFLILSFAYQCSNSN